MKVLSRIFCCFMAFGLVGCDDPETRTKNQELYRAVLTSNFPSDVFPFATACLETIETGSLTATPLIEAGFELTRRPNRLDLQKVIQDSVLGKVTIYAYIKKSSCIWRADIYGNYTGVAGNVVTILKKSGYEEVESDSRSARFFSKNGRTIKLVAAALRSQYGNSMGVTLFLQ